MLTIWSDLLDPWAYVAVLRLHRARDRLGATDLDFELRAWPAELTGDGPPSGSQVRSDVGALAQLESAAFSAYEGGAWPRSSVLAFEAQKWAFGLGQDLGERFDLALRRALFMHSHDLARRSDVLAVAATEGLDAADLAAALDDGRHRAAITADVATGVGEDLEGAPLVVLPDGAAHLNPGISYRRVRGLAIVDSDHPSVYEEIIRVAAID